MTWLGIEAGYWIGKEATNFLSYDKPIFMRQSFQIFAGTQILLTEIFCGFPQTLQTNDRLIFRFGHDCRFISNAFHFVILK
jgi:hypothetical protein